MTKAVQEPQKSIETKLENLENDISQIKSRIEQLEEDSETQVRVVDTDSGKKIVLENRQQTWFSPNYFRKILDSIDEDST